MNCHNNHKTCFLFFRSWLFYSLLIIPQILQAQSSNYWSGNFNEESSLVSGAVVGGGADPSAIYYNPAGIAEIEESKLSINASLFSVDYFRAKNAWGDDLDFVSTRFVIVPRFISYMLKPKSNPNWSLEFAFLNNENYKLENTGSVDKMVDILKYLPGEERYNVYCRHDNSYRDDWLGAGGSYKVGPELYVGTSMFVSMRSLSYSYLVDIEAGQPREGNYEEDIPFLRRNITHRNTLSLTITGFCGSLD